MNGLQRCFKNGPGLTGVRGAGGTSNQPPKQSFYRGSGISKNIVGPQYIGRVGQPDIPNLKLWGQQQTDNRQTDRQRDEHSCRGLPFGNGLITNKFQYFCNKCKLQYCSKMFKLLPFLNSSLVIQTGTEKTVLATQSLSHKLLLELLRGTILIHHNCRSAAVTLFQL